MNAEIIQDAPLWAITCYFNPIGYKRRLANYRVFRERLGVPLVAVELAYGSEVELSQDDADILVQLRGHDVMWQKERLLNIALSHVPATCRKVAWVDCDMIFEESDWAANAGRMLDRFQLVQLYTELNELQPGVLPDSPDARSTARVSHSAASWLADLKQPDVDWLVLDRPTSPQEIPRSGGGWAFRRELYEEHGFYDGCILGGGDRATLCAICNHPEAHIRTQRMTARWYEHYERWARPFGRAVQGFVGSLNGRLYHLWHGSYADRKIGVRHEHFREFQFDPFQDLALDDNGVWRWNNDKPEMHAYVRDYFANRNEDG